MFRLSEAKEARWEAAQEYLEKTVQGGDRILDLGCGSGILSIAGVLLGAQSALAVDIDPIAEKIAYENAQLNGVQRDRYSVRIGDVLTDHALRRFLGTQQYDVMANIVASVILRHMRVVWCDPVPNAMPGSSESTTRSSALTTASQEGRTSSRSPIGNGL